MRGGGGAADRRKALLGMRANWGAGAAAGGAVIPTALSWHYNGILMALQWHSHGISMAFSWHYNGIFMAQCAPVYFVSDPYSFRLFSQWSIQNKAGRREMTSPPMARRGASGGGAAAAGGGGAARVGG